MVAGVPSAAAGYEPPAWHKIVGITLALLSSAFIGGSFVFKKKGLLSSNNTNGTKPGEGHAYLKNPQWWVGMIMMLFGEVFNMIAYAFVPAILVTPLGALSVVISTVLSAVILKEHLSYSAKVGCAQCLLGAILIVVNNGEVKSTTTTMDSFVERVATPAFLVWAAINVVVVLFLIFWCMPRWGRKHAIVPIATCSLVGAFVVLATQGFGSAVVYTLSVPSEPSQFKDWRLYILLGFILLSCAMQIHFLNFTLNVFSAAVTTPIYYVCFTAATIVASAILFNAFSLESVASGTSIVVGFLVIVGGVSLLFAFSRAERRRFLADPSANTSHLSDLPRMDENGKPEINDLRDAAEYDVFQGSLNRSAATTGISGLSSGLAGTSLSLPCPRTTDILVDDGDGEIWCNVARHSKTMDGRTSRALGHHNDDVLTHEENENEKENGWSLGSRSSGRRKTMGHAPRRGLLSAARNNLGAGASADTLATTATGASSSSRSNGRRDRGSVQELLPLGVLSPDTASWMREARISEEV
ncbi:magnesium transporter NIPA-domain-containing protein [Fimicolochytrium jonesii]|uniref:magnesium transporter NIPA-domain-containing protein n=1 Tax=Fimicolochytrium jonesii TaxID=1396493 RepID=UPI0022FE55AD|nr:magnesium transporter NIPA-domain-containing protein [Fimicolochytrium jonesii]KAI8824945.1 magnesium transporter NIPA-domain-containing protein [Fimicolochytrium jonesii]